jgi:two-component system phosphate regulon sensor histidine kinase PhoR
VVGDKNELFRVLLNLIINATKYGYDNSTITVSAQISDAPPNGMVAEKALAIAVQDEGEGITPEHLPRLTERFYRVDKARSRAIGGTGLGLAIVRRILDRHAATMTIDSTPNKGSTFTIYLPLV